MVSEKQCYGRCVEAEIIEPEPELRLSLIPAPDEPPVRSTQFQEDLRAFTQALKASDINASSTSFAQDAIGGGGWSVGEITLLTTLGGTGIVQLRKLVETFLRIREGRKFKLKYGPVTLEGRAEDVHKLVTAEQIANMVESHKMPAKKTRYERLSVSRPGRRRKKVRR